MNTVISTVLERIYQLFETFEISKRPYK